MAEAVTKICTHCQAAFVIGSDEQAFIASIAPVIGGERFELPLPSQCPRCRQQQRLVWRNERKLYRRTCDLTGQEVVSMYSPDKPYPVYANDVWWSDAWDPFAYGQDVDFSRPIMDQIAELQAKVPKAAAARMDATNSDFCNNVWHLQDCYLCFNMGYGQDSAYCDECYHNQDLYDSYITYRSEKTYEAIHNNKMNSSAFTHLCARSYNVFLSVNCRESSDLILCSNLHKQQYCIRNVQYTKEEYERRKAELQLGSRSSLDALVAEWDELRQTAVYAPDNNHHVEWVRGDYVVRSKNCVDCFFCAYGENLRYIFKLDGEGKDSQDIDYCAELERCYTGIQIAGYQNLFSVSMYYGSDNLYGYSCRNTKNCFGCVGLRNQEYCILNKQYSKEEYELLMPKIIAAMQEQGTWGEFFPVKMALFAYNESAAQLYYPLERQAGLDSGAQWLDVDYTPQYEGEAYQPLDDIAVYRENEEERAKLLAGVLRDRDDSKPYRITAKELAFYLDMNLPIPTKHPDNRYAARRAKVNAPVLYERDCRCQGECHQHEGKCGTTFETSYDPERTERTFCQACYNEAVLDQSNFLQVE